MNSVTGGLLDTTGRRVLHELVSTPSPSGEETAVAERLREFFHTHDREAWIDDVGNVRAPANDTVLLTSHMDTVPGEVPVEIRDGDAGAELWGRGTVDATGPLAAMATAAVETGVSFAGVVEEETTSRGARHLVAERAPPEAVINGEPSGWDGFTLGYRGVLSGEYTATSRSGHSSRPESNAVQQAIAWWSDIEAAFKTDEKTPVFERVTAKPVGMTGGLADDGLAVEATVDAQFRIPPRLTTDDVRDRAERLLGTNEVQWTDAIPPVMQSPRTSLARAFRTGIRDAGEDPRMLRKTGTSDMNLFAAAWDCPMVTYGPGDSAFDHAPDEHLSLEEFDRAVTILETVCRDRT
ncbi:MAG: N-acetyl-ornithine/N-acetyl-lysine deacetylase [uncultured archaeon A07HR60]|nr:MAG: N-acetyl-ornithine/N-acetyl-lysine deacetylase [uncultured archaeon A07HR60]